MARSRRSSKLESRTSRLKLAQGTREWLPLGRSLALAYRRTSREYGTWQARVWHAGEYRYETLGRADDFQDANGSDILNFYQAQGRARDFYERVTKGRETSDLTVAEAVDHYLEWYREHRRAVRETEHAVNAHIRPVLGGRMVSELTPAILKNWLGKLATAPARVRTGKLAKKRAHRPAPQTADEKRARKATANRIFAVLKAALNKAFEDGLVADDGAWRKVRPFQKVDEPRIRFLSDAEGLRLVNACPPDLRALVRAALLTGARFGELVAMRAQDVDLRMAQVYVAQSKSGRPRYIPLNPEGLELFKALVAGRTGDELLFRHADGRAWGKNHHVRALTAACKTAKITSALAFHELRHTYASHLAQAGVDLLAISKLLGHADTRITSRHYAHLADKTLAAAVTKLPSFGADKSVVVSAVPTERVG